MRDVCLLGACRTAPLQRRSSYDMKPSVELTGARPCSIRCASGEARSGLMENRLHSRIWRWNAIDKISGDGNYPCRFFKAEVNPPRLFVYRWKSLTGVTSREDAVCSRELWTWKRSRAHLEMRAGSAVGHLNEQR